MTDLQSAHSSRQVSPQLVMWLVIGSLALSLALYSMLGHPGILLGQQNPSQAKDEPDVERMVANLAKKLESEPGNLKGWVMLARSYKVMGRNLEAAQAFERAGNFIDNDAQLLAIYADLIVTNAGGSFAGKPMLLIEKALKLEPDNVMALWLAGSAAYQVKNYKTAVRYWERISRQLVADSDDARTLQESINEAHAKLDASGLKLKVNQVRP